MCANYIGIAKSAPSYKAPPVIQLLTSTYLRGTNDSRQEVSDKQQPEQKSRPVIQKMLMNTESEVAAILILEDLFLIVFTML